MVIWVERYYHRERFIEHAEYKLHFFKPRQQCIKDTHDQLGGTQAGEWPSSFLLLSQHVLFKKILTL